MRTIRRIMLVLLLPALLAVAPAVAEEYTYGVEVNGVLCGYADIRISEVEEDGRPYTLVEDRIFAMLSVLGMAVNQKIDLVYHVDPETGRYAYNEIRIDQGDMQIESRIHIEGDRARCWSTLTGEEKIVPLPEHVILEHPVEQEHLRRDFADGALDEKTYEIFAAMDTAVQTVTYTKVGTETLQLAGRTRSAVIFDQLNLDTAVRVRLWLDADDYRMLKLTAPNGRHIYLADPSVRKKIQLVDVDQNIMTKTNVAIPDVQGITYMKVKAVIEPTGLWLSPEDLNVPGQRFEGTVKENLIEGIFEIEHPRYDGTAAPPFPTRFDDDPALREFLEPEAFIESADAVLVAKARELAAGSSDSWDAATRLSRWVAENIEYAIPGGGTPRKTYDIRAGECGAHSMLLATFCRAVGIPARVVWGGMYVPNYGGAFGQHAWTEIYMGDAGWIPVDATAYEVDFVDSGHVRIGSIGSRATGFNSRSMEVLDFRVASGAPAGVAEASEQRLAPFAGEYESPVGGDPFVVAVHNGALTVTVPGGPTLPLSAPGEDGRWNCTLTPKIYCTFTRDADGDITELILHEIVRMQRRGGPEPDAIGDGVPAELRPYLGGYYFAALQAHFEVVFDEGKLAIWNPLEQRTVHLLPTEVEGRWIDEFGRNTMSFAADGEGRPTTLIIDAANRFSRR